MNQPEAVARVWLLRMVVSLALIRSVGTDTPAATIEKLSTATGRRRSRFPLRWRIRALRLAVVVGVIGLVVPWRRGRALALLAPLSAHVLERCQEASFPGRRSTKGHLHQVALILAIYRQGPRSSRDAQVALATSQLLVAGVYSQAFDSKIRGGHEGWVASSRALQNALALSGTSIGEAIALRPNLVRGLSIGALSFEGAALPLAMSTLGGRRLLGSLAAGFHVANKATLNVSYWHLGWLSGALWGVPDSLLVTGSAAIHGRLTGKSIGRGDRR